MVHAKEVQYDRQIADMATKISKLESKIRQYEKVSPNSSGASADSIDNRKLPHQIKLLSEEVLRLRDKIVNQNSESLAMKSRLQTAVDRSKELEEDLYIAKMSLNSDAATQGHTTVSGGRRRNTGTPASIRTAMLLNSSYSDRTEQIGQVVDQIDSFAASTGQYFIQPCEMFFYCLIPCLNCLVFPMLYIYIYIYISGKYLRKNPLARAGFIFYLILIHLWTFVLLFFHAHSFDANLERDSGTGNAHPHGPHAIMQQHLKKNVVLQ